MSSRRLTRFCLDQRGTVLVEMALIVPLLVLLSAGIFEFGRFLHDKLLVEAGLSDAARFAARCNSQIYTDNGFAAIDCSSLAASIAVYGKVGGTTSDTPRVVGWQASDVTIDSSTCVNAIDPGTGTVLYLSTTSQVCVVTASTSFHYQDLGMLPLVGVASISIGGSHEERLIRF